MLCIHSEHALNTEILGKILGKTFFRTVPANFKKFLSTKEASSLVGCSSDYIGRLAREGKIPADRIGRSWVVEKDALLAYFDVKEASQEIKKEKLSQERKVEYKKARRPDVVLREGVEKVLNTISYEAAVPFTLATLLVFGGYSLAHETGLAFVPEKIISVVHAQAQSVHRELIRAGRSPEVARANYVVAQKQVSEEPQLVVSRNIFSEGLATVQSFGNQFTYKNVQEQFPVRYVPGSAVKEFSLDRLWQEYVSVGRTLESAAHASVAGYGLFVNSLGDASLKNTLFVHRVSQRFVDVVISSYKDALVSYVKLTSSVPDQYEAFVYGFVDTSLSTTEFLASVPYSAGGLILSSAQNIPEANVKIGSGARMVAPHVGQGLIENYVKLVYGFVGTSYELTKTYEDAVLTIGDGAGTALAYARFEMPSDVFETGFAGVVAVGDVVFDFTEYAGETLAQNYIVPSIVAVQDVLGGASERFAFQVSTASDVAVKKTEEIQDRAGEVQANVVTGVVERVGGFFSNIFGGGQEPVLLVNPGPAQTDVVIREEAPARPVYVAPSNVTQNFYATTDVNKSYVDSRITGLHAALYSEIQKLTSLNRNQIVQNVYTTQLSNRIDDLFNVTIRGDGSSFDGNTVTANQFTGGSANFASTTLANVSVTGDANVGGTLTVGGITTTGALSAPYFTATSNTATSTFAGSFAIDTDGFVYATSTGNVGIGVLSPGALLSLQNATNTQPIATFSDDTGSEVFRFTNTGQLGIGTTSPYEALSVDGNGVFTGSLTAATTTLGTTTISELNVTNATITNATTTNFYSSLINAVTGVFGGLTATNATTTNATTTNLAVSSLTQGSVPFVGSGGLIVDDNDNFFFDAATGRLGIGTTSPYAKLSVVGQTVSEYFTATSTSLVSTFPLLNSTSATSTQLAVGSLTAGRVPYAAAGGRLIDSSAFTFDGTTATINDFISTRATTTNATSTNLFSENSVFTNATSTNLGVTGDLRLPNLTASRLLSLNSNGVVINTDIASWVTGTSEQITVTDDSDGTITLSLPSELSFTDFTAVNGTTTNATSTNLYVSGQTRLGSLTGLLKATSGVVSAITTSAGLAGEISDETGTGSLVFADAPSLTSLTVSSGGITITGNSTITGTLSSLTGLTSSGTINFSGLTGNRLVATDGSSNLVNTITAANLQSSVTGTTGTGDLVFSASPTFTGTANFANYDAVNGTTTNATSTNLAVSSAVTFSGLTGLLSSNGASGVVARSLTQPAAGLTISNADGTAGNPTFALANDLSALEGLSGTGIAVRTAADTWVERTITGTANQITVVNGDGVSGNPVLSLPSLVALTDFTATNGTTTNATSTNLSVSGTVNLSGLTASRSLFLDASGNVVTSAGSSVLADSITDETGTGALVFANSPALVTPDLGTPSALVLTNATGLPLTTGVTGTLPVANGGTGATTFTNNRLLTGNGTGALVDEANLTFDGSLLTVTGNASTTQISSSGSAYFATGGGNVGIGTTTPQYPLDVNGDFRVGEIGKANGLFVDATNGYVGAGTGAPGAIVHAVADASQIGFKVERTAVPAFIQSDFGSGDSAWYHEVNTGGASYIQGIDDGDSDKWKISYGSAGNAVFGTNDRLTITTAGNVGIGTINPVAPLEVSGGTSGQIDSSLVVSDVLTLSQEDNPLDFSTVVAGSDPSDRGVLKGLRARGTVVTPTAVQEDDLLFTILAGGHDGTTRNVYGGIEFFVDGAVSGGTVPIAQRFYTGSTSRTERMRITSDGDVGIGTTTPASRLAIQTTGTTDILNLFETGGTEVFTVLENGNVGVGVVDPETELEVQGDVLLGFSNYIYGGRTSGNYGFLKLYDVGNGNLELGTTLSTGDVVFTSGGSESLRLQSNGDVEIMNGNVGIGTTTPWGKLSVTNTGSSPSFIVEDSSSPDATPFVIDLNGRVAIGSQTTNDPGLGIFRDAPGTGTVDDYLTFDMQNTATGVAGDGLGIQWRFRNTGGTYFQSRIHSEISADGNGADIVFSPAPSSSVPSEAVRITEAGLVGIGTTTPDEILTVGDGTSGLNNQIAVDSAANRQNALTLRSGGVDQWYVGRGDSDQLADSTFFIGDYNGSLLDAGGNSARFVIDTNGDVGIGTSTPNYLLDVDGDFNVGEEGNAQAFFVDATNGRAGVGDNSSTVGGLTGKGIVVSNNAGGAVGRILIDVESVSSGYNAEIRQNDTGFQFESASNSRPISFWTGGTPTERLTVLGTGNVGINDNSPDAQLDVVSASTLVSQFEGPTAGADIRIARGSAYQYDIGLTGSSVFYIEDASANTPFQIEPSTPTNTLYLDSGGLVGIGTAAPETLLHIRGISAPTFRIDNTDSTVTANDVIGAIDFNTNDSTANAGTSARIEAFAINSFGAGLQRTALRFFTGDTDVITATPQMVIDNNGNVGIGTAGPTVPLHVDSGSDANDDGLRVYRNGVTNQYIDIGTYTEGLIKFTGGNKVLAIENADTTLGDIVLRASSTEAVRILGANGNVGIGTAAPSSPLLVAKATAPDIKLRPNTAFTAADTVLGTLNFAGLDTNSGAEAIGAAIQATSDEIWSISAGTNANARTRLGFFTNDGTSLAERVRITNEGNVGIGTTSPYVANAKLTIEGNDPRFVISDNAGTDARPWSFRVSDGKWLFRDEVAGGGADRLAIDTSGNVGIGQTSPDSKLTVNPGTVGSTAIGGRNIHLGVTAETTSARTGFLTHVQNNFTDAADNAGFYWIYPYDTGGNAGYKPFRASVGSTLSDVFYVRQDGGGYFAGNVGIGTTNPSLAKLQIDAAGAGAHFVTSIAGSTNLAVGSDASLNPYIRSGNNLDLRLGVNSSDHITIKNGGNVGIGTTTPVTKLAVDGTFSITGTNDTGFWISEISGLTTFLGLNSTGSTYNPLSLRSNSQTQLYLDTTGNTGIGTTTPKEQFHVDGGASGSGDILITGNGATTVSAGLILQSLGSGSGRAMGTFYHSVPLNNEWFSGRSFNGGNNFEFIFNSSATGHQIDSSNTNKRVAAFSSTGIFGVKTLGGASANDLCYETTTFSSGVALNALSTCSSSERYKEGITDLSLGGLDTVLALRPVEFDWIGTGEHDLGFIAEEVEALNPLLSTYKDGVIEGVKYKQLTAVLASAVQEIVGVVDIRSASGTALTVDGFGNIGVGTTTPAYKLHVLGDVAATSFVNISTRESKKGINYLDDARKEDVLDKLREVQIAEYRYEYESDNNPLRLGLIAEEAPSEVLSVSGKGVDIYKLATFTLASVQQLAMKVESLEERVAALEASGVLPSQGGVFSTSTLKAAFSELGVLIEKGFAQFDKLAFRQLIAAKDDLGQSAAGSASIAVGSKLVLVENQQIKTSSKVFVTFTSPVVGSWFITDKANGSFQVTLDQVQGSDVSFDYFIVQTERPAAPVSENGVKDFEAPVITLLGANPLYLSVGTEYVEPGVQVTDNVDQNLSYELFVDGYPAAENPLDTSMKGDHVLTYKAIDTAGNLVTERRNIVVGDEATLGSVDTGTSTPDTTDTATTTPSGSGAASTTPPVATSTPPVVEEEVDDVAPSITLIGKAALKITVGDTFTDAGATATDDVDGDISDAIIVEGSVDTETPGLYTLEYSVSDAAGNEATVSRIVTVEAAAPAPVATTTPSGT